MQILSDSPPAVKNVVMEILLKTLSKAKLTLINDLIIYLSRQQGAL
ncbi:MAG: hypothetical protein QM500_07075 [Methylococcales bacterium]